MPPRHRQFPVSREAVLTMTVFVLTVLFSVVALAAGWLILRIA